MPFAGYADFQACVDANRDKDNPDAYCGSIKHKVEDKALKALVAKASAEAELAGGTISISADEDEVRVETRINNIIKALERKDWRMASRPHGGPSGAVKPHQHMVSGHTQTHSHSPATHKAVRKALEGPVAEKGDKKLTPAIDGAQDDQAYAVAHGPDNYDKLVNKAQSLRWIPVIKSLDAILHKQAGMAFPGDLKLHLQKALAAVHGREIFDPRYKQACKLLKQVCDLLESIEKTAEAAQGGSAAMVMMDKAEDEGWEGKPEGWTSESVASFWDTLTEARKMLRKGIALSIVRKKGFTECVSRMRGHVEDAEAFCAASHKEALGRWPAED